MGRMDRSLKECPRRPALRARRAVRRTDRENASTVVTAGDEERFKCAGSHRTNPDPAVRRAVIERGYQAIEAAKILGADYVKFWPGQDGFDYPLQADYLCLLYTSPSPRD